MRPTAFPAGQPPEIAAFRLWENVFMTRPTPASFGRAGAARANPGMGATASRNAFGRRVQPVQAELSFRVARLETILSELHLIIGDPLFADVPVATLHRAEPPSITLPTALDGVLRIEVDDQTGLFVLLHDERSGGTGSVVVTSSEERLIDHILSHLVAHDGGSRRELDAGVDLLVGHTLEAIVHLVVLRTLRRFRGSRQRAAMALGLSVPDLRARLRSAFRWSTAPSPGAGASE